MRNLIGFRRFGAINFGVLTAVVFLSRLFSCRPSQAADTIFFEDFDTGYAGWTTSGNVSSDNSPTIGSNSARMKKDGQFWRTIDTRGYSNISLMW